MKAETHTLVSMRTRGTSSAARGLAAFGSLAPDLFPTEIANAVLVAERRGRIPAGQGAQLLVTVLNTLPALHPALPDLLPRAYAIAPRMARASSFEPS